MSTAYYILNKPSYICPTCEHEHPSDTLELGTSSFGWCFSLQTYPELGLNNWDDVVDYIQDKTIIDEYDREISKEEFISVVTDRKRNKCKNWDRMAPMNKGYFGYNRDTDDVTSSNYIPKYDDKYSFKDDNLYLMRHKVDGYYCIGNGEGSWDYFKGSSN